MSAKSKSVRPSPAVGLALLLLVSAGCAKQLDMSEVRSPEQPSSTIRYTAIRNETRRFPDYSAIDRSILVDDGVVGGSERAAPSR